MNADALAALEERLGWKFKDRALLKCALTAPSCRMDRPDEQDNQRLEFLGDAVFGVLTAEALYKAWPEEQEGALTVRRVHIVSGTALAAVAEGLRIGEVLRRNQNAQPLAKGAKILADAMEALMGAVWLDGGIDAAKKVFGKLNLPVEGKLDEWRENPKGHLQILAQSRSRGRSPAYELVSRTGPAHAPIFTVRVAAPPLGEAIGNAGSLKQAEQAAAAALLERLSNAGEDVSIRAASARTCETSKV
ncbi:MAG: ribonuclease III [Kiritimatiellae bacterium]|nr:ribonuclease III [Kiritimatiellia bacterium]